MTAKIQSTFQSVVLLLAPLHLQSLHSFVAKGIKTTELCRLEKCSLTGCRQPVILKYKPLKSLAHLQGPRSQRLTRRPSWIHSVTALCVERSEVRWLTSYRFLFKHNYDTYTVAFFFVGGKNNTHCEKKFTHKRFFSSLYLWIKVLYGSMKNPLKHLRMWVNNLLQIHANGKTRKHGYFHIVQFPASHQLAQRESEDLFFHLLCWFCAEFCESRFYMALWFLTNNDQNSKILMVSMIKICEIFNWSIISSHILSHTHLLNLNPTCIALYSFSCLIYNP